MFFGDEHSMALDTKTGLSCWILPLNGKDASYERLEGETPTMAAQGLPSLLRGYLSKRTSCTKKLRQLHAKSSRGRQRNDRSARGFIAKGIASGWRLKVSKYDPLYQHLSKQKAPTVTMTFTEIEAILGSKLPPSARKYAQWWENDDR